MILEQTASTCLLGIRFWDPVLDAPIRDRLLVRAWPRANPAAVRSAFRTRSGVHAWIGLPGMREYEQRDGLPLDQSPLVTTPFVVEVLDTARRFVDIAFEQELPLTHAGPFLIHRTESPSTTPPGFVLFSAPTRTRPAGVATLHGELRVEGDESPAAFALVRADFSDGTQSHGLADANGRVAIFAPYPTLVAGLTGSPIPAGRRPLSERAWSVSVTVQYQPDAHTSLAGTELPDFRAVLAQGAASVFQTGSPNAPVAQWTGSLEYGRELVLHTAGRAELIVRPLPSSP